MGKRLISLLLAQAMLCANLSLPAFASPQPDTLRPLDATHSVVSSHLRHDLSSLEATRAWSRAEPALQDDAFIERLAGWMEDAAHPHTILVEGGTIAAQAPGFFIAWQLALERFQQRRKLADLQAAAQAGAARVLIYFQTSADQTLAHRLSRLLRDVNEAGAATDLEPSWFRPITEPPSVPIDLAIGSHVWLATVGSAASVKVALDAAEQQAQGAGLKAQGPATSLLGLAPEIGRTQPVLTGPPVPEAHLDALRQRLQQLDPVLAAWLPDLPHRYYADGLPSSAAIDVEPTTQAPIFLLEERLQTPVSPDLADTQQLLEAFLLTHEGWQYHLRKAATDSADLTEELALLAEVDRRLWLVLSPTQRQQLLTFAQLLDRQEPDRPDRLAPSLERLARASDAPDELSTWQRLAQEFSSFAWFAGQSFDAKRFNELRTRLRAELARLEAQQAAAPTPPTGPAQPPAEAFSLEKLARVDVNAELAQWRWRVKDVSGMATGKGLHNPAGTRIAFSDYPQDMLTVFDQAQYDRYQALQLFSSLLTVNPSKRSFSLTEEDAKKVRQWLEARPVLSKKEQENIIANLERLVVEIYAATFPNVKRILKDCLKILLNGEPPPAQPADTLQMATKFLESIRYKVKDTGETINVDFSVDVSKRRRSSPFEKGSYLDEVGMFWTWEITISPEQVSGWALLDFVLAAVELPQNVQRKIKAKRDELARLEAQAAASAPQQIVTLQKAVDEYLSRQRRSHRFPRVIKGQESWPVFERHLREAGITDEAALREVRERAFVTDRATGAIAQPSEAAQQAMAAALTELLGRTVTVEQLQRVILGSEEAIHAHLSEQEVVRIRDQLAETLGPAAYQATLEGLRRMYDYPADTSELELVEELIAKSHLERLLGNPMRLLDTQDRVFELDSRAAALIRRAGLAPLVETLSAYYDAKRRLREAVASRDAVAYGEAWAAMEDEAKAMASYQPPPVLLELAQAVVREERAVAPELIGEAQEIVRAAGPPLTDAEQAIIREVAGDVAAALAHGEAAAQLARDLVARTRAMRLGDYLPETLERFEQVVSSDRDPLDMLSRADASSFWGMTALSYEPGQPTEIAMRPLEDPVAFRVAYLHELIHDLSHQGLLPIVPQHELITHAATAVELVRARGEAGLRAFAHEDGELYWRLFARGEQLFREGGSVEDVDELLNLTQQLGRAYLEEKRAQAPAEVLAPSAEEKLEPTPAQQLERLFEFERFAGTLLGGYAWARERDTTQPSLAYLFRYAANVLTRVDVALAELRDTPAHRARAAALRQTLLDVARMLTRDRQLEFVEWDKTWTGSDVPEVRYLPELHKIAVPALVWWLDETVAKGLIAQEIFRALHARPDLITGALAKDTLFTELMHVTDTPRVIEAATREFPGARGWVDRLYDYRHTIPNLPVAQARMGELPLPFQYLAGVLWRWHQGKEDPRITDARVRKALGKTAKALRDAFRASPERHERMTREVLWPVVRRLKQQAINEGVSQAQMDQHAQQYAQQFGAQGLGGLMVLVLIDDSRTPPTEGQPTAGEDRLFQGMSPAQPGGVSQPAPTSIQNLAAALSSLVREAGTLEQLAGQAERTAQQLREAAKQLRNDEARQRLVEQAEQLDALARQLHQEAQRLHQHAGTFQQQAGHTAQQAAPQQSAGEAGELAQQAAQFAEKTQRLQDATGHFQQQTDTLRQRAQDEPETIVPALTEALHDNAQQLKDNTAKIHEHAGRLETLAQAVARALQQPSAPLQPLDFSPIPPRPPQPPTAGATGQTGGSEGYGPGLTEAMPPAPAAGASPRPGPESPSQPTQTPSRPPQELAQSGTPVSAEERARAAEILEKIPPPSGTRRPSALKPAASEAVTAYRAVKQRYAASIATLRRELIASLQQTEMGGTLGGLVEGDYLDGESLAQIKAMPPAVMAVDILPGEFNYRISYLVDVSGSMEGAKLQRAAEGAVVFLEATKDLPGVETEVYAFSDNAALKLKDYGEHRQKLSEEHAAAIYQQLFSVGGGGTADVAAIKRAITRIRAGREAHPGLRLFGIGIGSGTEKVTEAYAPHGYQLEHPKDIPVLIRRILKKQLTGKTRAHNLIIVLTDGNPGAENAAAIQKLAADNTDRWSLARTLAAVVLFVLGGAALWYFADHHAQALASVVAAAIPVAMGGRPPAPSGAALPFRYSELAVDGRTVPVLVINGQALELGPGGALAPQVDILKVADLGLPAPKGIADSFPTTHVARVMVDEGGRKQQVLVPLDSFTMQKLSEMIAILSSREKPNLALRGPAAGGKNTFLYLLAGLAKWPVHLMSLNHDTTQRQLVALQTVGESGTEETGYRPSPMVQAAESGAWGVADEVNKPANAGVLAAWYSLLEHRFITLPDGQVVIAKPGFRAIAMLNPDRPPYLVSEVPVDFERRFQFVEMDYLHAPKRAHETPEQAQARLKALAFILRLQAPQLYATNSAFFASLAALGQDMVEGFEQGTLPRPMTLRGLIRIVRHLEAFPDDLTRFMEVFGSAYQLRRLDETQRRALETAIEARLPGLLSAAPPARTLTSRTVMKRSGQVEEAYYQITDQHGTVLAEQPLPADKAGAMAFRPVEESQTVLRAKLALMKAMVLGEHVLMIGHTGVGKTSIALDVLANNLRRRPYQMQLNANTTVRDLWGQQAVRNGATRWEDSPLLLGMKEGHPVVVDDIGKPRHQAVNSALNNILQFSQITTPYGLVKAQPGFTVIATTTPEESRYAAHELSGEVEDRFFLLDVEWMAADEETAVLHARHPQVDPRLITRFVEAAGELRVKEAQQGELIRPVSLQDLSVTLERFQRENRTLFDVFLSAYGIEPTSDYVAGIKKVFQDHALLDERFSAYQPPPTIQEIAAAPDATSRLELLARLLRTFRGPSGAARFEVILNAGGAFSVATTGTRNVRHVVSVPSGMGPIGLFRSLRADQAFARAVAPSEQEMLARLLAALTTLPVAPQTGDAFLDRGLRYLSSALEDTVAGRRNATAVMARLESLARAGTILASFTPAQRDNARAVLTWLRDFELTHPDLRTVIEQMLAVVTQPTATAAPAGGQAATSLLGLAPEIGRSQQVLWGAPIPEARLEALRQQLHALDPTLAAGLPDLPHRYYAADLPSSAAIDVEPDTKQPVFLLEERLQTPLSPELAEIQQLLETLLLAHEGWQYHLRHAATDSADLTEELALLAEIDRRLWLVLSPTQRQQLLTLAQLLDRQEPDRPDRLAPSLERLARASDAPDALSTWQTLATELSSFVWFANQAFDSTRFQQIRDTLHTELARIEAEPPPPVPSGSGTDTTAEQSDVLAVDTLQMAKEFLSALATTVSMKTRSGYVSIAPGIAPVQQTGSALLGAVLARPLVGGIPGRLADEVVRQIEAKRDELARLEAQPRQTREFDVIATLARLSPPFRAIPFLDSWGVAFTATWGEETVKVAAARDGQSWGFWVQAPRGELVRLAWFLVNFPEKTGPHLFAISDQHLTQQVKIPLSDDPLSGLGLHAGSNRLLIVLRDEATEEMRKQGFQDWEGNSWRIVSESAWRAEQAARTSPPATPPAPDQRPTPQPPPAFGQPAYFSGGAQVVWGPGRWFPSADGSTRTILLDEPEIRQTADWNPTIERTDGGNGAYVINGGVPVFTPEAETNHAQAFRSASRYALGTPVVDPAWRRGAPPRSPGAAAGAGGGGRGGRGGRGLAKPARRGAAKARCQLR